MNQSVKSTTEEYFWSAVRAIGRVAIAVALFLAAYNALLWLWPWSLIFLEALALIWLLSRTGEGRRYSLRGLLILTAGMAVILATAAFVPAPMLGGAGGISIRRVAIEVTDESTDSPIKNAAVILARPNTKAVAAETFQGVTNPQGIVELKCDAGGGVTHSLLRTWRTYSFDGWLLEVKAAGYHPAIQTLSDVVVGGERRGPINFRVELERSKQ